MVVYGKVIVVRAHLRNSEPIIFIFVVSFGFVNLPRRSGSRSVVSLLSRLIVIHSHYSILCRRSREAPAANQNYRDATLNILFA